MEKVTYKQAKRQYIRRFWPLMFLYLVAILGGSFWLKQYETEPLWLGITVALTAATPLIVTLFVMLRYFEQTDEFVRLNQLRSFAEGSAIIMSAIFVIGFLQLFHVVPQIEVFWFGPAFFLAYGLAHWRRGGESC